MNLDRILECYRFMIAKGYTDWRYHEDEYAIVGNRFICIMPNNETEWRINLDGTLSRVAVG